MRHVAIILLILTALTKTAYAGSCANLTEKQALDARALQTQLMVAALSCNQRGHYNAYMHKFGKTLAKQGNIMTGYFNRVYARNGINEMNRFITELANASSKQSLRIEDTKFCKMTDRLFVKILASDTENLFHTASAREFEGLHGIGVCFN